MMGMVPIARAQDAAPTAYEFEAVRDIAYRTDAEADPVKHKLDLYVPKGAKDFPVLFFVHGGAWQSGSKGLYGKLGETFAKLGIGAVVINYRLSPAVKHPTHIQDVAKAFAWTVANVGKHGGNAERIFAAGHSAGGHLVSLLATDDRWLKAEALSVKNLRGVVPMSGVYTIVPKLRVFEVPFGTDENILKDASPLTHVREALPPFLLIYADKDFPQCDKMSDDMCKKLKEHRVEASVSEIKDRNHITIIIGCVVESDPATQAIVNFVRKYAGK